MIELESDLSLKRVVREIPIDYGATRGVKKYCYLTFGQYLPTTK
jgi:hypothetical protein